MGGIAGIIDFSRDLLLNTGVANDMLQKQKHRGPDTLGLHAEPSAILGSCRLSLSDPAGGSQPMTRSIGSHAYTLVYNGELYNANELRQELLVKGYAFYSHSDTELLLASYIEWGPSCVDKLEGMYAFAVWEEHRSRLFMARDRLGVKPLFYRIEGDSLAFASEIKALFCIKELKPVVDREGLMEIFALSPGRTPGKTPFKDIKELKPGECMIFSRVGVYIHRYWQFESLPHTDGTDETAEHVNALLKSAVRRQLTSDAPACALLSGGLDSSAICAVASSEMRSKGDRLSTYSIRFPDDERYFLETLSEPDSDSDFIRTVTEFLKTDHTVYTADIGQTAGALKDAAVARDLPGMADIDSSYLLFCREIAKSFKVAVSGECADELFGGYPWYHNTGLVREGVFPWSNSVALRKKLLGRALQTLPIEDYARERFMETAAETPLMKEDREEAQMRRRMFYINVKWFMANLLERQDRMGMACGLEFRSPFADRRLAEYAWNIPWEMMHTGGMEKGILRMAMKDLLPRAIWTRKKSPYPKTHHPDYQRNVSSMLESVLSDKTSALPDLIDTAYVKTLMDNPGTIVSPWYGQLMTAPQLFAYLLQLDFWIKGYGVQFELN
jgi:asparagine synthase (glutamine-hydrolysing)